MYVFILRMVLFKENKITLGQKTMIYFIPIVISYDIGRFFLL